MKLEYIVNTVANLYTGGITHTERSNNLSKFINEFNDNYQIVPKEQWCVTVTFSDAINATQTVGPFDSEEIANLFATIWNRKREEFINKTIEDNPDGDHYFPYMKAKPNKLDWSEKCNEIQTEIFEALKELK